MEWWVNPDESSTPILQHFNSPIEIVSYPLRHALCTLRVRRGAAGKEDPAHRIPRCCLRFRQLGAARGIPARVARAWLCRGKQHHH